MRAQKQIWPEKAGRSFCPPQTVLKPLSNYPQTTLRTPSKYLKSSPAIPIPLRPPLPAVPGRPVKLPRRQKGGPRPAGAGGGIFAGPFKERLHFPPPTRRWWKTRRQKAHPSPQAVCAFKRMDMFYGVFTNVNLVVLAAALFEHCRCPQRKYQYRQRRQASQVVAGVGCFAVHRVYRPGD